MAADRLPLVPPSPAPAGAGGPTRLPPLAFGDGGLTKAQRRVMVGAIAGLHVAALWGLLQVRAVREAAAEATPVFVSFVRPETPQPIVEPPPPPQPVKKPPPKRESKPLVVAAAPTPAPAPPVFVAPPPLVEPTPPVVQAAPEAHPAPPAPPAWPPAPRIIPASAVQYLRVPEPTYPPLSRRLREQGRVVVQVWCDEQGLPQRISVRTSSGHPRLDAAAVAGVEKARFKPYTENGLPVAGWAFIPLDFTLET